MTNRGAALYLHIGLPKTASTFLQEVLFPNLEGVRYLGIPRSDLFRDDDHRAVDRRILSSCFRRSTTLWRADGLQILEHLFGGGVDTSVDILMSDEGVGRSASRPMLFREHLRELVGVAGRAGFQRFRVLCFFRRQDTWLASHYAQVSDRITTPSQHDFERMVRSTIDPSKERYSFGMLLDYRQLHEVLVDVCGRAHVLMLPYEYLVEDRGAYLHRLAEFICGDGAPVPERALEPATAGDGGQRNVRADLKGFWSLRRRRDRPAVRLGPRSILGRLGLPAELPLALRDWRRCRRIELTEDVSQRVLRAYEASNRDLADRLQIDLGRYCYFPAPVPES